MLSRGKHAVMYTGHNLWKNSGHETPLCGSMLAQSGKHATQPEQVNPLVPRLAASLASGNELISE